MKVAVVGGGGFRTPVVWESVAGLGDAIAVDEVVLQDRSEARLDRIRSVIHGLIRERGGTGPPVRTTTVIEDAVEGADFVCCAIRVGGLEARIVDETVPLALGVLAQETVGPGGVAFALRTVPVMVAIAEAVARAAPDAWFLNFTNPAALVTEAVRPVLGDRVVGVCDAPAALCARAAAALQWPMGSLRFDYAGLNHLGWLLAVNAEGEDLLPGLLSDEGRLRSIAEVRLLGSGTVRQARALPNEYLVYYERSDEIVEAFRRAGETRGQQVLSQQAAFYGSGGHTPEKALASWRAARDARHGTYLSEAWASADRTGDSPDIDGAPSQEDGPGEGGYAAIAAAFIRAVGVGCDTPLILDVANRGRLPFLDDDAVVEVSCVAGSDGVSIVPGPSLPGRPRALVERMKDVERTTIRAATERSAGLALEAIAGHPLVRSRDVAERILTGYLDRHTDLRERLR